MHATAIIAAAGSGQRMGSDTPKQFMNLLGKPLLAHTLIPFERVGEVHEVIVVVPPGWEDFCRHDIVNPYGLEKVVRILAGGKTRQESVFIGLKAVVQPRDIVVVHDGVRPLVTEKLIRVSIREAGEHGAVVMVQAQTDTLKQVQQDGWVKETLDRENLIAAQTPQAFSTSILTRAYQEAMKKNFHGHDDACLVEWMGLPVKTIVSTKRNLKVTHKEDLRLAEFYLGNASGHEDWNGI